MIQVAYDLNMKGYPAPLLSLQPHLRFVADTALPRADERAAILCMNLGYHLKMIADYAAARPLFERALAIAEQAQGLMHPETARSLSNLAGLLQEQGDRATARRHHARARHPRAGAGA